MFATARTPPRCRTKMSLDTLKKQTDRGLFLIANFYIPTTFTKKLWGKDVSQDQRWNREWSQIWVAGLFSMVTHGNETFCSLRRGRNQCWSILPPLVLYFGEWPVVLPNKRSPQDMPPFLLLSSKPSVWGLELCSTTGPPQLSEMFLIHGSSAFSEGKGRLNPNEDSKLRLKISTWSLFMSRYFHFLLNVLFLTFIKLCLQRKTLLLPLFCARVCSQVLANPLLIYFPLALLNRK